MSDTPKGRLIIIGGHEQKADEMAILSEVAARAGKGGRLVVITAASQEPESLAKTYEEVFAGCGVKDVRVLHIFAREDALRPEALDLIDDAAVIFFTGGDQLRITSQIGDSPVYQRMHELYRRGATIAGTSAGAAAMPATMLVSGRGDSSDAISGIGMAPGLGLLENVVIDTHFAERGRMSRILGAVSQNPRNLGLGIDENTAVVVDQGRSFRVLGSGAVYVVDGASMSYSSLSEERPEGVVTIHGVTLHVLGEDDCFDLAERRPVLAEQK